MIAELYGKISRDGSNLSDRMEDDLTGNVFGNLRYLPFEMAMKHILEKAEFPDRKIKPVTFEFNGEWSDTISFWPRYVEDKKRTEIDVVIDLPDVLIGIEVKLHSGISSDDDIAYDTDVSGEIDEISCNQLARENDLLKKLAKGKRYVLLFLAKDFSCLEIYRNVRKRNLVSGDILGYLTWQQVHETLSALEVQTSYQQVIVDDLVDLLEKKNLNTFVNFFVAKEVKPCSGWEFDDGFYFDCDKKIERREYYEFR